MAFWMHCCELSELTIEGKNIPSGETSKNIAFGCCSTKYQYHQLIQEKQTIAQLWGNSYTHGFWVFLYEISVLVIQVKNKHLLSGEILENKAFGCSMKYQYQSYKKNKHLLGSGEIKNWAFGCTSVKYKYQ